MESLLTAQELADLLKVQISAVRSWTRNGLPHVALGGRLLRYRYNEAVGWLQSRGRTVLRKKAA